MNDPINVIFFLLKNLIKLAVAVVIVLMLLRGLISWLELNPFGWFAYHVNRITEPMVAPLRGHFFALQTRRDIAPLLLIILIVILAFFTLSLVDDFRAVAINIGIGLNAVWRGAMLRGIWRLVGALAFGAISVVITCVILQVIFSWVAFYGNWLSRTVARVSEPVLAPFRRMIPPLGGMLDISPLIAILVLSLISSAVQGIFLS